MVAVYRFLSSALFVLFSSARGHLHDPGPMGGIIFFFVNFNPNPL